MRQTMNFMIASLVMIAGAGAQARADRASIAEQVRQAFGIETAEVFTSYKEASALRDAGLFPQYRMVVTSAQRATLHQLCLSTDSHFVALETFGPADQRVRQRFESFLLQHLAAHGADRKLIDRLPTPVSASVEKVNCFSDASDAVLGLIYAEKAAEGTGYFKVEIAVAEFN